MKQIKLILMLLIAITLLYCSSKIRVEYPVFPNSKEGRLLKKFISDRRNVAVVVEKKEQTYWSNFLESTNTSFIDLIPEKVFSAFDEGGYYKMLDTSKREDILKEQVFSEAGLTTSSIEIGQLLGTELLLFIKFERPVTECGIEGKVNKVSCGVSTGLAIGNLASKNSGEFSRVGSGVTAAVACQEVPTGVRIVKVPLVGTLVNPETGQTLKAVSLGEESSGKSYSSAGNRSCPAILTAFDEALQKSVNSLKKKLVPKMKTAKIKIIRKDANNDVAFLLNEGYLEIKGETPNFRKASEYWEKALRVDPSSEGANANMGSYYFATGDFENAVIHYEKAMRAKKADRNYWREQRKRVDANMNQDQ
ncbi:MAG: lipoprotein LipL41 [Spirochaetia bacterium]|nr:lipoprotein LipL41 [Spirochaetia bacterium]